MSTSQINGINDKKEEEQLDETDKPYSYLKSKAATWKATESRMPYENKPPWQGLVISASMAVFMIYFFVLREESDIDKTFTRDLRSHFPEMSDAEFRKAVGGSSSLGPPK